MFIGDCVIGKARAVTFALVNSGDKDLKFRWNSGAPDREEFAFYPSVGHLENTTKLISFVKHKLFHKKETKTANGTIGTIQ